MIALAQHRVTTQWRARAVATTGRDRARRLLEVYFFLLVFEGVFRKWLLPGMSNYFVVCRDPVVVLIYFFAIRDHFWPTNRFVTSLAFIAAVAFIGSEIATHTNFLVEGFGVHANFLHLPLIFIMGDLLVEDDLNRIADRLLVIGVPMAVLMAAQFQAPSQSFLNAGAGEASAQLDSVMGHIRPAGTFTFCVGTNAYFSFFAAFLFADLIQKKKRYRWWFLGLCAAALLTAVAVSGSRSLVVAVALVVAAAGVIVVLGRGTLLPAFRPVVIFGGVCLLLSSSSIFQTGVEATSARWEGAAAIEESEGGIVGRFVKSQSSWIDLVPAVPALGFGLGVGTSAGAALSENSAAQFYETEFDRIIIESGAIAGIPFIVWRFLLTVMLLFGAVAAVKRAQYLPLLLVAPVAPLVLSGQLGQPTVLGFTVFGAGLVAATMRKDFAKNRVA